MTDIGQQIEIGTTITLIVAPLVLYNRLLAAGDRGSLADLFAIPVGEPWPHGIQEEEPVRWRWEAFRGRTGLDRRTVADRVPRRQARPGRDVGVETGRCTQEAA